MTAFFARIRPFWYLMRFHAPIGILLLLWPTLWALWLAADGLPSLSNLIIFTVGVIIMRAAGCVINDFADRKVDGHVKRTQHRPLATGEISSKQALVLFVVLIALAFSCVLFTNNYTVLLSVGGLGLASLYPFMKRYTHLPQVVLGAAFAWAIPMAYMAEIESLPSACWLLYLANMCWVIAYDTQYAMTDREDDVKIGVKSTAILFGRFDLLAISLFQLAFLGIWGYLTWFLALGYLMAGGLCVAALCFIYQYWHTRNRQPQACLLMFKHNNWVGMILFITLVFALSSRTI